jgi:hypothetical protein
LPSVIRNWKRFAEAGAAAAVQASEDVAPASQLREDYAKIQDLERALSRKTMEVEILRAAQEIVKKTPSCARLRARPWKSESSRRDAFSGAANLPPTGVAWARGTPALAAELLAGRVHMLAGGAVHPWASLVGGPRLARAGQESQCGEGQPCSGMCLLAGSPARRGPCGSSGNGPSRVASSAGAGRPRIEPSVRGRWP